MVVPISSKSSEISNGIQSDNYKAYQSLVNDSTLIHGCYKIDREIGHGSQGKVFKATDTQTGRNVALKQLRIDSVKTWKEYELFSRESEVLASLNIEGVAHFVESFECLDDDPPCAYIVQDFIEGETLAEIIDKGTSLDRARIYDIGCQLAIILEKIHAHDPVVIHRDLKPGNVIIGKNPDGTDQVHLIDFGAVANPQIQTGGSTVAGTYGYMPPEQLVGNPVPASDIYALGAMMTYMLSGVSPSDMQVTDFRLVIEPHLTNEPSAVISLLRQMLDPNAETRLCDYGLIQRAFAMFREDKFNIDLGVGALEYGSDAYNSQLVQVGSLWQPGNFALWQALPDKTPREMPKEISRKVISKNNIRVNFPKIMLFNECVISLVVISFWLIILLMISAYEELSPEMKLVGLSLFLGTVAVMFGVRIIEYTIESQKEYKLIKSHITNLYQNGLKAVAVIENIQYLPTDIESDDKVIKNQRIKVTNKRPKFAITYRYRPEGSDHDIKADVITHQNPLEKIMVGDVLPILYDENGSVPYPFAPEDIENLSDICQEKQGRIAEGDSPPSEP